MIIFLFQKGFTLFLLFYKDKKPCCVSLQKIISLGGRINAKVSSRHIRMSTRLQWLSESEKKLECMGDHDFEVQQWIWWYFFMYMYISFTNLLGLIYGICRLKLCFDKSFQKTDKVLDLSWFSCTLGMLCISKDTTL